MCLVLSFDNCENKERTNESNILEDIKSGENDSEWHCDLEETVNKNWILNLLEYLISSLFFQVIWTNQFISSKWEKRYCWKWAQRSRWSCCFCWWPYVKEKCHLKIRSRNNSTFQFILLPNPVYVEPDEVY